MDGLTGEETTMSDNGARSQNGGAMYQTHHSMNASQRRVELDGGDAPDGALPSLTAEGKTHLRLLVERAV